MPTDPKHDQSGQQEDATNQGVSPVEPAEGADDAPSGDGDSPDE
jgi:hypothetical protein